MKLLHTSDWHLGRGLYGRKRYKEFTAFLDWLAQVIRDEAVDILLVAGDIFDTTTPSNRAQELYYNFLCNMAASSCRHVVIIAGNHDSPSLLAAPRDILRFLNVHVIPARSESGEEEVLFLEGQGTDPGLIVCAVPYLRDRDIRNSEAGESLDSKQEKLATGIRNHYHTVCHHAQELQKLHVPPPPLIAMGHLFTAGGKVTDGDGVRDLYVGNLAHLGPSTFPEGIDYLALGHLHSPQCVGQDPWKRYSGAPLAMGFGEAGQEKSVVLIDCASSPPLLTVLPIPTFQRLESIKGDLPAIQERLAQLKAENDSIWLEIIYQGQELISDLQGLLREDVAGSQLEILRILNNRLIEQSLARSGTGELLDNLSEYEVFERCLESHQIPEGQRAELRRSYRQLLQSLHEADSQAV